MVIWITGLSGSGKTTVAAQLAKSSLRRHHGLCLLDGDDLRRGLNSDLGFSPADRAENGRRVAEVAGLLARAGLAAIEALISPCEKDRRRARQIAAASGVDFFEVFLDCPRSICEQRDPKGLYKKARAGELPDFTGVDAGYERPREPDLTLHTGCETPHESVTKLLSFLSDRLAPNGVWARVAMPP